MNLDIGLMTFDLQAVPGYARRAEEMVVLGDTEEERARVARAVKKQSRSRATGMAWPISSATRRSITSR